MNDWRFLPAAQWHKTRRAHDRRLHLPPDAAAFIEPLIERAKAGVLAVSKTAAVVFLSCWHFSPFMAAQDLVYRNR